MRGEPTCISGLGPVASTPVITASSPARPREDDPLRPGLPSLNPCGVGVIRRASLQCRGTVAEARAVHPHPVQHYRHLSRQGNCRAFVALPLRNLRHMIYSLFWSQA